MKPRITLSLKSDCSFEMLLNEASRDELVSQLQSLNAENDHFHIAPAAYELDCAVSDIPYRASDKILSWSKVCLRTDAWDQKYFPHVIHKSDH